MHCCWQLPPAHDAVQPAGHVWGQPPDGHPIVPPPRPEGTGIGGTGTGDGPDPLADGEPEGLPEGCGCGTGWPGVAVVVAGRVGADGATVAGAEAAADASGAASAEASFLNLSHPTAVSANGRERSAAATRRTVRVDMSGMLIPNEAREKVSVGPVDVRQEA